MQLKIGQATNLGDAVAVVSIGTTASNVSHNIVTVDRGGGHVVHSGLLADLVGVASDVGVLGDRHLDGGLVGGASGGAGRVLLVGGGGRGTAEGLEEGQSLLVAGTGADESRGDVSVGMSHALILHSFLSSGLSVLFATVSHGLGSTRHDATHG